MHVGNMARNWCRLSSSQRRKQLHDLFITEEMMIFTASKTTFVLHAQLPKHSGKMNAHEPVTRAHNRPSQCRQRPLVPFRP